MKTKHKITPAEPIEKQTDPLARLDKRLTKSLDNFFAISAEDDDLLFQIQRDPEYQAVERFLALA